MALSRGRHTLAPGPCSGFTVVPVVSPRGMGPGLMTAGPCAQQGLSRGCQVLAPVFPFSQDLVMAHGSWLWSPPQEEEAWVPFEFLLVLTETPDGAGRAARARSQPGCDHGGWGCPGQTGQGSHISEDSSCAHAWGPGACLGLSGAAWAPWAQAALHDPLTSGSRLWPGSAWLPAGAAWPCCIAGRRPSPGQCPRPTGW